MHQSLCCTDLPLPEARKAVPRVITFQRKRANRRVINEAQLVRMLHEFADEVHCLLASVQPCALITQPVLLNYAVMHLARE